MTHVVQLQQCLMDVCLIHYGSLDALFALADANDLTIDEPLLPGAELVLPLFVHPGTVAEAGRAASIAADMQRLSLTGYEPATDYPEDFNPQGPQGIGYDRIGLTTIVY